MLHLFNSCYVYPEALFDPTCSYVAIGENFRAIGAGVTKSFYHNNTNPQEAIGRFRTSEEFLQTELFQAVISNKDKFIIYCDDEEFIKLHAAYLKSQITNLNDALYLQLCRLFYVKLKTRSKLIPFDSIKIRMKELSYKFLTASSLPKVDKLPLSDEWVRENCGIEWALALGKTDKVENIVNRYVYSYYEEAKANFLSRKDPAGSWVDEKLNQNYNTVVSFKDLYNEIRKEIVLFSDTLILDFYKTKDHSQFLKDPKFLLLLTSNKDMADKIDIWLLRWFMTLPKQNLNQLGILA
jgi:hypothetical protein